MRPDRACGVNRHRYAVAAGECADAACAGGLPKRLAVSGPHGAAPTRITFGITLMLRAPLWAGTAHVMKLGPIGIADSFDQPVPARHDRIQQRATRRP